MLQRGPRRPSMPRLDAAIAWHDAGFETALSLGSTMRMFGMSAVVDTQARDVDDATAWCRALGAANLLHCRAASSVMWHVPGRKPRQLAPDEVANRLATAGRAR
jgi:hypothetical protein